MEQEKATPIELMGAMLSEMAERAVEAERERDTAKKDADTWYKAYMAMDAKLKELEETLRAEIEEHQRTKQALRDALDNSAELQKRIPTARGEGNAWQTST